MRKLLLVVVMALLPALTGAAWAAEDLTAMTNADRTAAGLAALNTAGDLQSFAQRRAEEMAKAKKLWHTSNLGSQVANWQRVGENVGRGPNLRDIQTAFMDSASHRDNILHPSYSEIGVGVASDGGQLIYVAVIFRQPKGGAAAQPAPKPAPAPAPTPPPAPKPKPVVAAAPAPTTTTTTTAPPPPPEPAPEVAPAPEPAPVVEPVPVEEPTTTTTTPTTTTSPPVVDEQPLMAASTSDVEPKAPARPGALAPLMAGTAVALIGGYHSLRFRLRRRVPPTG